MKKLNLALIVLVLLISYSKIVTAGNPNSGVLPINSNAFGKSYGVWGQEFVNWLFQYTLAEWPLFETGNIGQVDCGERQKGKVWFLVGTTGDTVTRDCTIPSGKALFIALNSAVGFAPVFGETEEELRADAERDLDGTPSTTGVQYLYAEIDGVPLDDLFSYRASSPEGGFVFSILEGTILTAIGIPAGDYEPAIVDGYWLLIPPLSRGEHTIKWQSIGQGQDGTTYDYSVTWNLTVGKSKQ